MLDHPAQSTGTGHAAVGTDESLIACFERVAAAHRDRTALVSDDWSPTYGELNAAANRLAHAIIAHGGSPGDRVAILMQHDAPQLAAILAVLKAGRIVVLLSATHPVARLQQVIDDAEPRLIVADFETSTLAAEIVGPGIESAPEPGADEGNSSAASARRWRCDVMNFSRTEAGPDHDPRIPTDSGAVAFLVYTSGSTGRPKGVMTTHKQRLRNVSVLTESMALNAEDRIALFGSLSHAQGVTTAWLALLNGAALFPFPIVNRGITGLQAWMIDRAITIYISSASIFRSLMKAINSDVVFSSVRAVRLASEPATSHDFKQFQEHFPENCVLVHTLQSSETSNIAVSRWSHGDRVPEGVLPVGTMSRGNQVMILDERGNPVPFGEVGEIVVRSRHLAAGYWRNPALTAERFSDAADGSGDRVFRTGDLARISSDGILEFSGRNDNRVKIRGYRIELSEISDALQRLPGIAQAVVEAIQRSNHEPMLVAFVVDSSGHRSSPAIVRRALRTVLPDYMVPSKIVVVEGLPLTTNGKIDREKLRQSWLRSDADRSDDSKTETESVLADLWTEVFDVPHISKGHDFFDLGGDSLIAAVIAARVHTAFGVELGLGTFADHPVLSDLACFIDDLRSNNVFDALPPLVAGSRDCPAPLSLFQQRAWEGSQTPKGLANYTDARPFVVDGPLHREALRECLVYMTGRHEILRTVYSVVDGAPVQITNTSADVELPFVDATGEANPEEYARSLLTEDAKYPIDLRRGPLQRYLLIKVHENKHWFVRTTHHSITDPWMSGLFYEELALLYEARVRGEKWPLPQSEQLQYRDFAVWQREVVRPDGPVYRSTVDWWSNYLSDAPRVLTLPFKRHTALPGVSPVKGYLAWGIDADTTHRLREFCHRQHATYFTVRLAAFVVLLAAETGEQDIVLGTYVKNRPRVELQRLLGFFVNLAVLRFRLDPTQSFVEWLRVVREVVASVDQHGGLPYEVLRAALQDCGMPDVQVIFSASGRRAPMSFGGLTMTRAHMRSVPAMPWGFSLNFDESDEQNECRVIFDAGVYDPVGVRRFVARYSQLLAAIARNPDNTLQELMDGSVLSPLQRAAWAVAGLVDRWMPGFRT